MKAYRKLPVTRPLNATASFNVLEELDAVLAQDNATKGKLERSGKQDFIAAALSLSPHLLHCAKRRPHTLDAFLHGKSIEKLEEVIASTQTLGLEVGQKSDDLMRELRLAKTDVSLLCGLSDLSGEWDQEQVTQALSDFADAALIATIDFMLSEQSNKGKLSFSDVKNAQQECGLFVLAMGKYGARELNYSSDIDLIVFFEDSYSADLIGEDPAVLWPRIARQLVAILQERTADGYVFRTDLRLRPDPSSTPLVIPVTSALNYYEGHGQNWERAAFIKARPVAGNLAAGAQFLKELRPFVWRRHLDFAAIQDVHSIKRQIHAHKGHGEIAIAGHNIKLGRGGIREIEFFAQTQQLIAGGRVPELRQLRTDDALRELANLGWTEEAARSQLTDAYRYLRDLEHRLQMVGDDQTHTLPDDDADLLQISLMMGHSDLATFKQETEAWLRCVEKHYGNLFESSAELSSTTGNLVFTGEDEDPQTLDTLSEFGFTRPVDVSRTIRGWHFGRYPAMQTSQSRELLTELTPVLLAKFAETGVADQTFFAFDRFIAGLPAGIQLFSLLKSNPTLLDLLIQILGSAPRMADLITRKPHIFDGLLDPLFASGLPERSAVQSHLAVALEQTSSFEAALDAARIFAIEQRFLIGVHLLKGGISAKEAAHAFTRLAELLISAMLRVVQDDFAERHGVIQGSAICVLAMGRLGSCELTASSDLDLIFLYDYPEESEYSNGEKQLHVTQYFMRLVQRLITAMKAPTAQGVLYELDFRLRPSGNAGPLATHIDAFVKYQQEDAWIWEAQALTRARVVAGNEAFAVRVSENIQKLLQKKLDRQYLAEEVLQMRRRILEEKGSKNPWDIKNVDGGFVDLEFIAQFLVLSGQSGENGQTDTQSVLKGSNYWDEDSDMPQKLLSAFTDFTYFLQITRLCLNQPFDRETVPAGLDRILCVKFEAPDLRRVQALFEDHQAYVRAAFSQIVSTS